MRKGATMIISASRRTDIPNYFSDWFLNRLHEGFFYVRNPMNTHQISKIPVSPELVDCIVFWTKNPKNILENLGMLEKYTYYFQFTLTGYGRDVEPNLPSKREELIPTFKELSKRIGREKVIWRYDPIFVNQKYSIEYHIKAFSEIAKELSTYTEKVIISFGDFYEKTVRNTKQLDLQILSEQEMLYMALELSKIAHEKGLNIESCAEILDLQACGIQPGNCIDGALINRIIGSKLHLNKDKNQRKECGCMESIDIGTYNTCRNGCKYCYANYSDGKVNGNLALYDVRAPLLCGSLQESDIITERKVKSLKVNQ